jgi:hypothetical protein
MSPPGEGSTISINSLINFGVPGISGERAAPLQPIMGNKFRITFYDFGDPGNTAPYVCTQQLRSASLPTLTFGTQTLYSYVSTVYIATRAEWSEMTIKFLDDITSGVTRIVEEQQAKQQNMFDQTTSRAGENYKFEMDLDMLAGGATAGPSSNDPNILRRYSYAGCLIVSKRGPDLSYENANGIEFDITVKYDNVVAFDNNGVRLGSFSDTAQINGRVGVSSTGIGAAAGAGVSINTNSVSLGAGASNLALG